MHPMFKELFIDTDADALVGEDDRRRRARRSRRARPALGIRPAAGNRQQRPRPGPAPHRPQPNPGHTKEPDGARCLPPHRSPSPGRT